MDSTSDEPLGGPSDSMRDGAGDYPSLPADQSGLLGGVPHCIPAVKSTGAVANVDSTFFNMFKSLQPAHIANA